MAGSWASITGTSGRVNGAHTGIICYEAAFTAASDAGFDEVLQVGGADSAGFLQRFSVKFGATAPSGASFTVRIADKNGVYIGNPDGTALTGTSNITVNAYYQGPLYIYVTGNETNSATGTVSLYVK